MGSKSFATLVALLSCMRLVTGSIAPGLHFSLESRATNIDGSLPIYKNPEASIEDRVNDLLPRMTVEEKVAQLIQGDLNGWMNMTDPLDNTKTYNQTGLEMMRLKGGSIWAGYLTPHEKLAYAITIGQKYLLENTTLGIPALIQSEGLHGFTDKGTIFPSPIGLAVSFNPELVSQVANITATEAEGLGINHIFAPVLDLARELRWGRVEEGFGEDPFLSGELGHAFVTGLQSGNRRNTSSTAFARMAATCKHFAAFGSPQGGLNLAQVSGGERELRTTYLKPFDRACLESLSIMTAYSSYDGVPAIANTHLLTDILRTEMGYKYWVVSDAGSVDREHTPISLFLVSINHQVKAGTVDIKYVDETVKAMLRTKFVLGLFENPYPYENYETMIRTPESREVLHRADVENIVLLENRNQTLPLKTDFKSIALLGPQANRVSFGDYVFANASLEGISPLEGFKQFLAKSSNSTKINFAQGCELWSNDESGIPAAVEAAKASEVAMVGTWSLDQTQLWTPGTNATTGEHVDVSDLGLVGAQLKLVQAVKATGKPTVVVFVSGKPVAEPWIAANADAVVQQFYPGELGGTALAEIIFGAENPSGKLPVSFPRHVGTPPVFYNYLKGSRPLDPGAVLDDGQLNFGHQYVLNSPVPLWSFGHGLSYTTFEYSNITLSSPTINKDEDFIVTVTVKNTGDVDGKEVVQVYMTDLVSSVVVPNKELIGFEKVDLKSGESKEVSIKILSSQLAVWTIQNTWAVEAGAFNITVGTSDQSFVNATLTVQ